MKEYIFQIYYNEQEGNLNDTVRLVAPGTTSDDDVKTALSSMNEQRSGYDEDEDRLSVTDDLLDKLAEKLGGLWQYVEIFDIIDVA